MFSFMKYLRSFKWLYVNEVTQLIRAGGTIHAIKICFVKFAVFLVMNKNLKSLVLS